MLRLVQFRFPHLDQQAGLRTFLNEYLLPLHNSAAVKNQEPVPFKRSSIKALFEFDEMVHMLLRDQVGKVLYDVYKIYFASELKGA